MDMQTVLDKALEITKERHPEGFVSSDATFLGAVLFQLFAPQPAATMEATRADISHHTVDHQRIKQAAAELKGKRVQCKDVFQRAFDRLPSTSEALQTGNQLRLLGYRMKRYAGKNLYSL